jgi:hypothetical protein
MPIEIRLEDPSVGSNLLDFFHRNGLRAVLDGAQIWQIVNPDYRVEIETRDGSE